MVWCGGTPGRVGCSWAPVIVWSGWDLGMKWCGGASSMV